MLLSCTKVVHGWMPTKAGGRGTKFVKWNPPTSPSKGKAGKGREGGSSGESHTMWRRVWTVSAHP